MTLEDAVGACVAAAHAALCQLRLSEPALARSIVESLLQRLESELAERPAHETIELRSTGHQVLHALGDARAATLLVPLVDDMHARAAELTCADDLDRLIQALPVFRAVFAAQQQRRAPAAPG